DTQPIRTIWMAQVRDIIQGRPVKLRNSLSHPDAVDPRQLFPRQSASSEEQRYVHFTVSRAGMDLEGVLAVLAGHSPDSLRWGSIGNPHRSSLCTQVVSLPLKEWVNHVLPRWSSARAAIIKSSTGRGGTFDIGDVSVQGYPIDASLSSGFRHPQGPAPLDLDGISKAVENGVFVPPPEPERPPIRGYEGVKQASYKQFPFVNYFDLHALDYPRCRDHLIGLAALSGNFRQAISFLFARGYSNAGDAARAFDAGDFTVCAALLPERFQTATEMLESLSAGATWKEAFLSCKASRRYICSGLSWIWNGLASRRISLSRHVLPGDLVLPPASDTPIIVKDAEDARSFTLSDVVLPLNLIDEPTLPTVVDAHSAVIPMLRRISDLAEVPLEKFRPLVSLARSVYIDPIDGGALRVSFTLDRGSYPDVAMREVCGNQILRKLDEKPKK
ncbi:hypothetical protein FOZ63_031337, partial [Perkinsus olseni]